MGSGKESERFRDRKRWVQGKKEKGSEIGRDEFRERRRKVQGQEEMSSGKEGERFMNGKRCRYSS